MKKVKETVRLILEKDIRARNDDMWLTIQVLRHLGFNIYVNYCDIPEMPSLETIRRSRQFWQNTKNLYLPSKEIGEKRDKNINKYKKEFKK